MAATLELVETKPKPKKAKSVHLARVCNSATLEKPVGLPSKISVILKSLLDALDGNDLDSVVRVYREAMCATRSFWKETGRSEKGKSLGAWVEEPDHRTRLSAANMVAAYMEGLPVQRQILMRGDFVELGDLIKAARQSSEAGRLLGNRISLPSGLERSE